MRTNMAANPPYCNKIVWHQTLTTDEPVAPQRRKTENPRKAADWIPFKGYISKLLSRNKWTVPLVKDHLHEKYGFDASISQYNHEISKWKHKKRNIRLRQDQIEFLIREIDRRKRAGKRTAYRHHGGGAEISPERVELYLKRKSVGDASKNITTRVGSSAGISLYTPSSAQSRRLSYSSDSQSIEPATEDVGPHSGANGHDISGAISPIYGRPFALDKDLVDLGDCYKDTTESEAAPSPVAMVVDLSQTPPMVGICNLPPVPKAASASCSTQSVSSSMLNRCMAAYIDMDEELDKVAESLNGIYNNIMVASDESMRSKRPSTEIFTAPERRRRLDSSPGGSSIFRTSGYFNLKSTYAGWNTRKGDKVSRRNIRNHFLVRATDREYNEIDSIPPKVSPIINATDRRSQYIGSILELPEPDESDNIPRLGPVPNILRFGAKI